MNDNAYINGAQQRVLKTMLLIAEYGAEGVSPGVVAQTLKTLPSNTTRDLANLRIAGLIERTPSGNWRSSPRLVSVSDSVRENITESMRHYYPVC